jgi:hypothetical protein
MVAAGLMPPLAGLAEGWQDSSNLAGIGLDVVRAAIDSERLKQSSENQALRRAARRWKNRATGLEHRLRSMEHAMTGVKAEFKGVELDRDHARAELRRKEKECSKLRGFQQRILASTDSGTTSMALLRDEVRGESSLVGEPKGRARLSPNGTVVGGSQGRDRRRRSVSASDKVRNWQTDDAVCAEAQLLAAKVALLREGGWAAADTSGEGSEQSLLSTPLSPVNGNGADLGWDQLLDVSAEMLIGEAEVLNASLSDTETGAATRHSTDASDSGCSSRSRSRSRSNRRVGGERPLAGLAVDYKVDRWGVDAAEPTESPGVNSKVYTILAELERKADELQQQQTHQLEEQAEQEQHQQQVDQHAHEAVLHANALLQKQLIDAQREIRQVRSANQHLVESVNAVRLELRGTPFAASMIAGDASGAAVLALSAMATPAAAAVSHGEALRRVFEATAGSCEEAAVPLQFQAAAMEAQAEPPPVHRELLSPGEDAQSPPSPAPTHSRQPQERPPQPSPPPGSPPRDNDRTSCRGMSCTSSNSNASIGVAQHLMPRTTSRAPYVDENGVSLAEGESSLSIAATNPLSENGEANSSASSVSTDREELAAFSPAAFSDDRGVAIGWGDVRGRLSATDRSMLVRAAQQRRRQREASPVSSSSSSDSDYR